MLNYVFRTGKNGAEPTATGATENFFNFRPEWLRFGQKITNFEDFWLFFKNLRKVSSGADMRRQFI